jgi:hypothetical protein
MLGGLFFFEFLTSFTFENHDFLIFNPFPQLLVCQMCQEEGFKFGLDTRKSGSLPLDPAYPESLYVRSPAGLPS